MQRETEGYKLKVKASSPTYASRPDAVLAAGRRMAVFATWLKGEYANLGKKHSKQTGDPHMLDPFVLRVDELYANRKLRLYFQFDGPFFGYIIGVTDRPAGAKATEADRGSMTTAEEPNVPPGQYSNVHESTGAQSITSLAAGASSKRSWDAMAKIAAEGNRWQCVARALRLGVLTDDLVFYTPYIDKPPILAPAPPPDLQVGIAFKHLWLFWSSFKNAYGIPDSDVSKLLNTWYRDQLDWDWSRGNPAPIVPAKPTQGSPQAWKQAKERAEYYEHLTELEKPDPKKPGPPGYKWGRPGPPLVAGNFGPGPGYLKLQ